MEIAAGAVLEANADELRIRRVLVQEDRVISENILVIEVLETVSFLQVEVRILETGPFHALDGILLVRFLVLGQ